MKVKTSELIGSALDWVVAKCKGVNPIWLEDLEMFTNGRDCGSWHYSTDWFQGGPIIEQECINLLNHEYRSSKWIARFPPDDNICRYEMTGQTPLIAAMRCYVTSKLGYLIDIPEELLK